MIHRAEFVGGPKDGELQDFPSLPAQIVVFARPADHYAKLFAASQPPISESLPSLLEGVYRFDRLAWTFAHPGITTLGIYVWQGYR